MANIILSKKTNMFFIKIYPKMHKIALCFMGVLHPEMPDILLFLLSSYFYNLNFKYVHIHS